ncbi:MAG: RimK family alpha-L-glutamate ligase [Elusimicrobiota bacterium]
MKIALATCRRLPEPDHDERPLLAALRAEGADARAAAWDDPSVDWAGFDLCVIRSTWNYVHHLPEFLAWAKKVSRLALLVNPLSVVRWNSDKSYFKDLAKWGVRTVPTIYYPRGSGRALTRALAGRGWSDIVIKPRVGASSFLTKRFNGTLKGAQEFLRRASAGRDMMIQPYVPSVETRGERSLVYIAGKLTHSVRKNPRLSGEKECISARRPIDPAERRFALRVMSRLPKDLLYARVDVARAQDGGLMLMELELIEPSLFLVQHRPALRLFARACALRARAPR